MLTTTQQAAGQEAELQSSGEPTDPLFYPSWYKAQPRQTSNSNTASVSESRQVGPSIPIEVNVKKSDTTEATSANGSSAVSGKEANTPTATSQVSI